MNNEALGLIVVTCMLLLVLGFFGKMVGVPVFRIFKWLVRMTKKILKWISKILVSILQAMGIKFFSQFVTPTRVMNRFHERLEKMRLKA